MEIEKLLIDGSEFPTSTIINYSSLIQILSLIINKCNNFDNEMNEKEKRLSNLESLLNINTNTQSHYSNSPSKENKSNISKEISDPSQRDDNNTSPSPSHDNEKNREKIQLNYTMFSELYKKVKDHSKSIKSIVNSLKMSEIEEKEKKEKLKNNNDMINSSLTELKQKLNNFIEEMNKKITNYDTDLSNINEKMKDFNLYDMLKFDNMSQDIDTDFIKKLILSLEKKTNEKFNLYSTKLKSIDLDLFKMKEEQKNNNVIVGSYNSSFERLTKLREELNQKYDSMLELFNNSISEMNNQISFLESRIKQGEDKNGSLSEEQYMEFKNSEKRLSQLITSGLENINRNTVKKRTIETISEDSNEDKYESIKNLQKSINSLEKFCKKNFEDINIKGLKNRILVLEKNTKNYLLYEDDIANLNDKNTHQDNEIKEHSGKIDSIFQDFEQFQTEMKHLAKKVDSISYDVTKLTCGDVVSSPNESKSNAIDYTKFISVSMFNDSKKENLTKIEKVQKKLEEIEYNIESILKKLSHTPNDTDFAQFQDIIKTMLDNLIIKNKKQFANKFETVKSYKLLETKLNSINDSYNKKIAGAENWLLAKKPLNNYQCASCESLIKGDLEQKNEFVAWNKYPNREENKTYRMGHGFSHMLQMINEGLMKETSEALKEEEKKKVKKEEIIFMDKNKKNSLEDLSLDMLPKIKKRSHKYNLSLGYDSSSNNSRDKININSTVDNQDNAPHIVKILRKNKSSVFKTIKAQNEKPKNIDRIKFINFNINNNKETE